MTRTARINDRIDSLHVNGRSSRVPASALLFRSICGLNCRASTVLADRSAHHAHFVHHIIPVDRLAAACGGIDARGVTRGYDDDGNLGEEGIAPLHGAERPPVHQWHREVEE